MTLSSVEQSDVAAFLFQVRRKSDADYQAAVQRRLDDNDPSHWLSLAELEERQWTRIISMNPSCAVFLHLDLWKIIPKRGTQRERILRFLRSLAGNPFLEGDASDKDPSLRLRQIKVIGDYAITFWADHPAKSVMIVDILLADN